jgi:CRP/FNR family transcriptional regulator, anaerobic regulatory protein
MNDSCNRHCAHCLEKLCTRGIPIFAALEYSQLEKIASLTVHVDYPKGAVIIAENSLPDFVAIISQGSVKASKYTLDGREQILYVFAEGDFFGEQNLLFNRAAFYSVSALEPVNLCLLRRKDFQSLLQENPDIGIKIIEDLGWRLAHLENAVQNMGVRSLEARIGTVLLELASRYGTPDPEGILVRLPLSREGLANYIGVARETISRKLGQLEDDGVIRAIGSKSLLILKRQLLEETAGLNV